MSWHPTVKSVCYMRFPNTNKTIRAKKHMYFLLCNNKYFDFNEFLRLPILKKHFPSSSMSSYFVTVFPRPTAWCWLIYNLELQIAIQKVNSSSHTSLFLLPVPSFSKCRTLYANGSVFTGIGHSKSEIEFKQ